jgi:hypothetical protein
VRGYPPFGKRLIAAASHSKKKDKVERERERERRKERKRQKEDYFHNKPIPLITELIY